MSSIQDAERVVVKIGSSSLTSPDGHLDVERLKAVADALAGLQRQGKKVVLVTSGAIAAGLRPLGFEHRPRDLASQQAAAAVGQVLLTRHYSDAFAAHDVTIAQLLLTVDDVLSPTTYRNALNTMSRLFRLGVVPVVNENDTVATQEIRFGDNDRLAALIAHLVRADMLFLFSDVDGLYTAHPDTPGAELIQHVDDIAALRVDTSRLGSRVGTGGMRTKVQAADIATSGGVTVVLANADRLAETLAGTGTGTVFAKAGKRRPRRLLWLAHAAKPTGKVHIDAGALQAITRQHASLLPVGVTEVEGAFDEGDAIAIIGPEGNEVGRGFAGHSSYELREALKENCASEALGMHGPIVHRDLLVMAQ